MNLCVWIHCSELGTNASFRVQTNFFKEDKYVWKWQINNEFFKCSPYMYI